MVAPPSKSLRLKRYKKEMILEKLSYLISMKSYIIINRNKDGDISDFNIISRNFNVPIKNNLFLLDEYKYNNKPMFITRVVDSTLTGGKILKVKFNE